MIKHSSLAITLCLAASISFVTQANEHENMMQQMLKMQTCISETVDMRYLEDMATNGEKMAKQIKQLCESGQRQQAQDSAMAYAKDIQSNPNFQAMQKCTAPMGRSFPGAQALQEEFNIDSLKDNHVCDEL